MNKNDQVRKTVTLETKEQFNIYVNPMRQKILHELEITEKPLTPKSLSDKLLISASSVQHHIKKLVSLGVVAVDHTESINGIKATFYTLTPVIIQLGFSQEHLNEKRVLLMQLVNNVLSGFMRILEKRVKTNPDQDNMRKFGEVMTGVVYITEQERVELIALMDEFILKHEKPCSNADAWNYAIVMYNTKEDRK